MKLRLLLAVLLAASCTSSPNAPNPRIAQVNADLDALVAAVTSIHPAPFASVREEAWRAEVEEVRREAEWISSEVFRVRVAALADLGAYNGHGGVFLTDQPGGRMFAVRAHLFPEGWHVVDARDRSLVGTKLEGPGPHRLSELRRIISADNYNTESARLAQHVVAAPSEPGLGGLSYVDSKHQARATKDTMTAAEWAEWVGVDVPQIPLALPRPAWAPRDDPWWSVRRGDALVVGYERVVAATDDGRTVRTFADGVRADVARRRPRVAVVDIRRNPGGELGAAKPITDLVRELVRQKVPVRVLVSWSTYSAASMAFAGLREELPALRFYGEPTGGGSFTYGNPQAVTLPHSGIVVHVASVATGTPGVDAIEPDVEVVQSWRDWRAGRDTVLERALAG